MKIKNLVLVFLFRSTSLFAQNDTACDHPLFNKMPNHTVSTCKSNNFNEITLYQTDKSGLRSEFKKSGEYLEVSYIFTGEWEKRPSYVQIYQNYATAVVNAGGKVLYKSESEVYLSLKKSGDQYWIYVMTDGSGTYFVKTVKEAFMKQDIVVTAEQIKKDVAQEGKAIFYGIYFETGKATLKAESAATITEIAQYLKANSTLETYIVGHTDNTGTYDNNMKLSMERAQSVINDLVLTYGIGKDRTQAAGVGSLAPVASNNTEEGKAKNRRVEMVLK